MALSRRNILVGLGALVGGGGALVGTGAFSTVSAERSVSVSTSGDGSAQLGLNITNPSLGDDSDGTITINVQNLNLDAEVSFEDGLQITNNTDTAGEGATGDIVVDIYDTNDESMMAAAYGLTKLSDLTVPSNSEDRLRFYYPDEGGDPDEGGEHTYSTSEPTGYTLSPGDSIQFDLWVNTLMSESDGSQSPSNISFPSSITIEANSV